MAAVCHLGFVGRILRPPIKSTWGVFIAVQNLVGIALVFSIIQKGEYFASLASKCLFTRLVKSFWGKMGHFLIFIPLGMQ